MAPHAAHQSWWQTFEAVFGVPFLAAIALQLVAPLSLPRGPFTAVFITLGIAFLILGVVLVILVRRELARHGQPTGPGHPTTAIVTSGIFSISRNPLYLGGACLLAGISLAVNLPWALLSVLAAFAACHLVLIAPEERYLASKFGAEYTTYAATVRRWAGRARRPR